MPTMHLTNDQVRMLDTIVSDDTAEDLLVDSIDPDAGDDEAELKAELRKRAARSELQMLRGKLRVQLNKIDKARSCGVLK